MIATYAILNPISRLRLQLNAIRQLVLAALAVSTILFLEFFQELHAFFANSAPSFFELFHFSQKEPTLSSQEAAFILVLIWVLLATCLHKFSKPRASHLNVLSKLTKRLHDESRYLELIELVTPYLKIINQAAEKKLLFQNTREWILNNHLDATSPYGGFLNKSKKSIPKWIAKRIKPLAVLLPARKQATHNADEILDVLMNSDPLRIFLLKMRPDFALGLLKQRSFSHNDFSKKYLRELVSTRGSHLYLELSRSRNLADIGYYLDPKNTLIFGLFSDISFASSLYAWKPVGDEAIRLISNDADYQTRLNSKPPSDEDLQDDPIYIVLRFFDIMVTTAARKDHSDQMWLMYLSIIVREIEQQFTADNPDIDFDDEFPTLADRLIYEAFDTLSSWIRLIEKLPENSSHLQPEGLQGRRGVSIPYWAVSTLCNAMRSVATSEKLSKQVRISRFEGFVRTFNRIPTDGPSSILKQKMLHGVIHGPDNLGGNDISAALSTLMEDIDHTVTFDLDELKTTLEK